VVVIEHNLDVIKTADWVIDLGPEGGADGGRIVAAGTPEEIAETSASHTGYWLKKVLPARSEDGFCKEVLEDEAECASQPRP